MQSKKRIAEYDVLRVIVTILVIVGHCTYYELEAPNGGCDYTALTFPQLSLFYRGAQRVTDIIYMFHMPLYMALSGALLRHKETVSGGYKSFRSFFGDKSRKLLLPFVLVLTLYAVPLKWISGFYVNSSNMFKDVLIDEVFIQKNFYLWYLPTLFCIFVVNFILEKNFHIKMIYKLTGMFILSSVSSIIPLNLLRLVVQFAFWFYIGFCFEKYRERLNNYIAPCLRYAFISMFIFVCLYILYCSMPNPDGVDVFSAIKIIVKAFCAFAGCFGMYCISLHFSHTNLLKSKVFYVLRNNTFGMYLYSDPWNYIVLAVLTEILGNAVFVTCWGSAVMYFGRLFITGSVSLMISCFLKKIRYYMANLK